MSLIFLQRSSSDLISLTLPSIKQLLSSVAAAGVILWGCMLLHLALSGRAQVDTFFRVALACGAVGLAALGVLGSLDPEARMGLYVLAALAGGQALAAPPAALLGALSLLCTGPWLAMQMVNLPTAEGLAVLVVMVTALAAGQSANLSPGRPMAKRQVAPPVDPALIGALQTALGYCVVQLDCAAKTVVFPFGPMAPFGPAPKIAMSQFLQLMPMSVMLDLLPRLQKGERPDPIRFTLSNEGRAEGHTLHVLFNRHPEIWLAVHKDDPASAELETRTALFFDLISIALQRKERLLLLAAQDLQAPAAELEAIGADLRSGQPWADHAWAFEASLSIIQKTLADLSIDKEIAAAPAKGPTSARRMSLQLRAAFEGQMARAGLRLTISLPETADLQLNCDYGRIFIALSNVMENALDHSRATEISVAIFLGPFVGHQAEMSWHVQDNGQGIPVAAQARLFDPLAAFGRDGQRSGIGLFAARKAMRAVAGDLRLQPSPRGSHFILTHPVVAVPDAAVARLGEGRLQAGL